MDPTDNISQGTTTSQEATITNKKKTRGSTRMARVPRMASQGFKYEVEIDEYCAYLGENRPSFGSHLGVLTRQHIPIGYRNWKEVDEEFKTILYDNINVIPFIMLKFFGFILYYNKFNLFMYLYILQAMWSFNSPLNEKALREKLMLRANKHWKEYRYNLGCMYFTDESSSQTKRRQQAAAKRANASINPPTSLREVTDRALDEQYQGIGHLEKADWDKFVEYRNSAEFKVS